MMLMKQKVVSENRSFPLRVASNEKESDESKAMPEGGKAEGRRNRSVPRISRISNHQSPIANRKSQIANHQWPDGQDPTHGRTSDHSNRTFKSAPKKLWAGNR
jgi:hypothetical protein